MRITFTNPVTVGDLQNRITVQAMDIVTFSINFAPSSGNGNAVVSVTLRDPVSGYQQHFMYEDNSATPTFLTQLVALQISGSKWLSVLLNRLITDAKIPAGTIS